MSMAIRWILSNSLFFCPFQYGLCLCLSCTKWGQKIFQKFSSIAAFSFQWDLKGRKISEIFVQNGFWPPLGSRGRKIFRSFGQNALWPPLGSRGKENFKNLRQNALLISSGKWGEKISDFFVKMRCSCPARNEKKKFQKVLYDRPQIFQWVVKGGKESMKFSENVLFARSPRLQDRGRPQ